MISKAKALDSNATPKLKLWTPNTKAKTLDSELDALEFFAKV
jgi:hypothetical protein